MEKYENLGLVGEGSYGIVMKCRHKATGTLVAIKKFLENEDDRIVRQIAQREIKMLKKLRHENLVSLIDVFKRRKKLYLVFEYLDKTLLDDLEGNPGGLEDKYAKRILFQVLRGIEFCHNNDIIHRDIKPENILVSKTGVVKLCDFGFARSMERHGKSFTDYVATRWYRAPELLVGDTRYGKPVDIWAVGCLTSEMYTGDPLFPGDSDLDQIFLIIQCIGPICSKHVEVFKSNSIFKGIQVPNSTVKKPIDKQYPKLPKEIVQFILKCLNPTPELRPSCTELIQLDLFDPKFSENLVSEIKQKVGKEHERNPLLKTIYDNRPTDNNAQFYSQQTSLSKAPSGPKQTNYPVKRKPQQQNVNYSLTKDFIQSQKAYDPEGPVSVTNEVIKTMTPISNTQNTNQIHDDDGWEDVRPLTSRKERVASRAGRVSKREQDESQRSSDQTNKSGVSRPCTAVSKQPANKQQQQQSTNDNEETSKEAFSSTIDVGEQQDPEKKSMNDNDNSYTSVKPIELELDYNKVGVSQMMGTKIAGGKPIISSPMNSSETSSHPRKTNHNSASTPSSSTPLVTSSYQASLLSKSNQPPTISPTPNFTPHPYHHVNNFKNASYFPTIPKNENRIKTFHYPNHSTNPISTSNTSVLVPNTTNTSPTALTTKNHHPYFIPHHMASHKSNNVTNANNFIITNNDNNNNNKTSTTTTAAGFYPKKKTITSRNNNNINNISSYHDNNISLPELKGAEMHINRNYGSINNSKFKYNLPNRSNFNNSNNNQDSPNSNMKHV